MKRKTAVVKLAVLIAVVLSLATRAEAILGIGDIVVDPSVYAQAVQQLLQLERQYAQLVQSYQVLQNQYAHLQRMAQRVPVDMSRRYRAAATLWRPSSAANTYGTTGRWLAALNSGVDVAGGYVEATERLLSYDPVLGTLSADQADHVKRAYGTVELTDGATRSALETVGRLRANASSTDATIQRLEDDSLSADPAMNTEIAVLNKVNAASLVSVRTGQDTNKLLVALAEAEAVAAKRTRDAEARAITQHVRFLSEGKALLTAQASGASRAMLDWRMP